MNATIKIQQDTVATNAGYHFISFPTTSANPTPSYLLYHESALQKLASELPFQPGSVIQIPFFVYVSDTLS